MLFLKIDLFNVMTKSIKDKIPDITNLATNTKVTAKYT